MTARLFASGELRGEKGSASTRWQPSATSTAATGQSPFPSVLSFDPALAALLAVAGGLYVRAIIVLRRRGHRVRLLQQVAWWAGLLLTAAGLMSGIDRLSEDLLSAHMAQHLLIAELGAPLLLLGMRSPVLLFMLPTGALKTLARRRRLRRTLACLARPLVAVPLYTLVLYLWHFDFMFEGALRSEFVHGLQHQSFVAISVLVWWSALEPNRFRLRGELWKAGHIFGARLGGMMLGMAFVAMRSPAYGDFYGQRAGEYGMTPLADQQIAGGMMLILDTVIVLAAVAFFFWRASEDDLRAQAEERAQGTAASGEPLPTP